MKKLVAIMSLALMTLTVAGCSSDYVLQKKNGEMIITHGKPEVDDDNGLITYEDVAGNEHAINRNQIIQMIEK
ncbi:MULTISPECIES: YgdI/YgdR family lipoprotein [Enterobacter cloacae complex]|uniref:YgdI/YgdR family lipoprotein n=1 Tax=Enterobacter cloacae complex TaxID=354276 RepID=UPI0007955F6C|nr:MULTISPECIES: YgdI/YgdR family lipoprotein [Enterobacter]MBA7868161.1 YgdI/YgdR family lipoprotein [Enterobacter hormaechei]MBJ6531325.1 YgdI/YgdR family lipoprotein [Enterobacter hormaechei]MBT1925617.1 YgdI/YgdR family lipoprotein [Enterobacter hormaechei subsp. hoffmannii]MBT1930371.1 YgdI/YgdR family lipoprotein [Enterobacter hormaechei subsp. hoffmannii]MBT1953849.1 YgdI/YgdR family lipoprotein [Enterobacter hormaechei subsp. hoffmannii]